jgi:putative pyruvate formate lyase activating enzyme
MHRQVGPLVVDDRGIARRGLLVRHLVMPGAADDTRRILEWLAAELGPGTYVNVMDQYRPAGKVLSGRFPELERRPSTLDHERAVALALDLGLRVDGLPD